jgi:outer membrane protein assembly factor BamA
MVHRLGWKYALFILSMILLHAFPSYPDQGKPLMISKVEVEMLDVPKKQNDLIRLAINLIRLKKGDMFSSLLLEQSIDALRRSERFQNIHVDSKEEEGEITLFFHSLHSGLSRIFGLEAPSLCLNKKFST